ncbi:hypothetical protein HMPREF1579_00433 [Gardnerella vaginalis JCP8066]|nr:hypothetical protein HMPREF1579_00433 [Gardnerella vaginalis JCP8066]
MESYDDGKKAFISLYIENGFNKEELEKSSSLLWAAYCKANEKKNVIDIDVSKWAIDQYLEKYSYLKNGKCKQQDKQEYKFEIVKDGIVYRGDTMTSFGNFIRKYFVLTKGLKSMRRVGKIASAQEIIEDSELPKSADSKLQKRMEDFAKLAHSKGNLIPVPLCFNSERSGKYADSDYWDIVMYCIFKWCHSYDDKYLFELLNRYNENDHMAESVLRFKKWMDNFNNNWKEFVRLNYLSAFVDQKSEYWYPKEFWTNHFAFNRKIDELLSSDEFYKAVDLICNCIEDRNKNLSN